ncbi:conserved membrane hypothetical protein [Cupriavidus taiwanensis]|nr:conserved membrane hypothetical protein [Cupriavidus taiwanensis]SOY48237.1 conserved membrane hypothetical protein [Cupriavidus taiwanensis]SOY82751.1 conserved membrane hypothetical protein [Cupriavidus taiwanensis]SOZ55363.1 conserved membrane hypothetical protein [Cupriavidus taiwanensis]SOZ78604.1 conserved membrane hypothetical protein [Cupriavidus taiwanensis]
MHGSRTDRLRFYGAYAMTTLSSPTVHAASPPRTPWYIFAGFAASLVSIGLARFAYTPLLPALIDTGWFSASNVVFLAAANLAGYLLGALAGHPMARRLSSVGALRLMMVIVTLAFVACAWPLSVSWYFAWRLASGVAGGAIMVLAPGAILTHVPRDRRGIASGAIFLGIGVGIAGSGTIVPLLLQSGLRTTWLGLALIAAVLTGTTWSAWPRGHAASVPDHGGQQAEPAAGLDRGVVLLYAQYGLMAMALVPTMVFLVDFVARGLGAGAHAGALFWVVYGGGAIMGPPVYGWLADHLGARRALRVALIAQAIAVAMMAYASNLIGLAMATAVIGTFPPGIVPLALARLHERIHAHHRHGQAWSRATISFATCQAIAGYAYSAVFAASGGAHRLMFGIAVGCLLLALGSELVFSEAWVARSRKPGL